MDSLTIPDAVRGRALAQGPTGDLWLAGLPDRLAQVSDRLRLSLGATLSGGTSALVVEATLVNGRAAVLKVFMPGDGQDFTAEHAVLKAAGGRAYAELLAADGPAQALVLERLGPNLRSSGLTPAEEAAIICALLPKAWACPTPPGLTDGAQKARDLAAWVETKWSELGHPCSRAVMDLALDYARDREAAFDPARAVTGHGDGHAWNALAAPHDPAGWKLVDPDGLFIEPAYDLGVLLREWTGEADGADLLTQGRTHCEALSAQTGVGAQAIWAWGYLERVATGLAGLSIHLPGVQDMLEVAEAWRPGL